MLNLHAVYPPVQSASWGQLATHTVPFHVPPGGQTGVLATSHLLFVAEYVPPVGQAGVFSHLFLAALKVYPEGQLMYAVFRQTS